MKYNLNINQKAIIDNNLDIDIIDACIVEFARDFTNYTKVIKIFLNGKTYCWFDYNLVSKNLPILSLKKDSVYRRFKKLCEVGIMEPHPDNQSLGKPFYCLTDKSLLLVGTLNENASDINPDKYGLKSEHPTDFNPDNNSIIHNNIIISKRAPTLFTPPKPIKKEAIIYREFKHLQLLNTDFLKLKELGFTVTQIDGILDGIENYAKNKNYTSLYLTAKKWLEKEYPNNQQADEVGDVAERWGAPGL